MSLDINPTSAVGKELHRAIQSRLAHLGWASADDDLLAEFVVVMLQNHKTSSQVSAELSELVGADYDASFVTWLWETAEALLRGEAAPPQQDARRSASPMRERSPVRQRDSRRSRSPVQHAPRGGSSYVPQHHQQAARQPPREPRRAENERGGGALFARALGHAGRQGAPPLRSGGEGVQREYAEAEGQQMGNGLPPPRAPRGMNAGLRDYAASPSAATGAGAPSILARFSVPDPRASAFTPASHEASPAATTPEASGTPLLMRLDPMLPVNALPVPSMPSVSTHSAPWPSTPSDSALCRYGLRCTNPVCAYSHPSAAALASSSGSSSNGMAIDEPLVLNAAPCRFQAACTRADCERSHVSPAQAVLAKKNGSAPLAAPSAAPAAASTTECRFGTRCTRADCRYAHPGKAAPGAASTQTCRFGVGCTRADCKFVHPQGRTLDIAPPDEDMRDSKHVSERLRRFATAGQEGEGEVERIIPGAA